jgi:MarR family transcriptional regulator, lower aerobic nicotinate degradation pathway regulator
MRLDHLKTLPGHLVRRAQQNITSIFTQEMAEFELTSVQYLALVAIDEIPDLDATRLAEHIYIDRATIGGVIERLERKRLIKRRPGAHDKRTKILSVTPAGRAMIAACFERVIKVQSEFLAPLNRNQRVEFMHLLTLVANEDRDAS